MKHKRCTSKQKELLNLFSDLLQKELLNLFNDSLLDAILTDKILTSKSQNDKILMSSKDNDKEMN